MNRYKKAFSLVRDFYKHNFLPVIIMILLCFGITVGADELSDLLISHNLTYIDYALAVVNMFLQSVLSCSLIFIWYKKKGNAAAFSPLSAIKLFCSMLLVSLLLAALTVTVIGIQFAVWFFLRLDFYINIFMTSDKNGIVSCIRESFRRTKGLAKPYFIYNLRYLSFYIIVTTVLILLSTTASLTGYAAEAMNIVSTVFSAVFLPYRFLIKCGFYDEFLGQLES